jgi:VanZ family protein
MATLFAMNSSVPNPNTNAVRRVMALWAAALRQPSRALRTIAIGTAALLVVNVLWQGAQPYAVGLFAEGWDKVAHAALHYVLCSVLLLALGLRRGVWALVLCASFAAIDEWAQQFSPGRSVSFYDWLASVAGAMLALAVAHAQVWANEMKRLHVARRRREKLNRWWELYR